MADIKISDATPIGTLDPSDMLPIARTGSNAPFHATLEEVAAYVTVLASQHPPSMSSSAATAGSMEEYSRADHVHPTDTSRAAVDSPHLVGLPTAPTMLPSDASDSIATTKFVHDLGASGTLRTQTPGIDDNSELVATTEFVQNQGSTDPPLVNGIVTAGASRRFSRGDHTHPVDATRYAASNPAGYVDAKTAAAAAPVQSVAGRAGAITLTHTDITDWTASLAPYAPLASPPMTGVPTAPTVAPTAAAGTTQLATTQFVRAGTTTNDNALAGQVGEFISGSVASPGVTASNAVVLNVTTISLTAGDWDVQGQVGTIPASGTKISNISAWPATTSATFPTTMQGGLHRMDGMVTQGGDVIVLPTGRMRMSIAATTTVYLSAMAAFAGGTLSFTGFLGARRIR